MSVPKLVTKADAADVFHVCIKTIDNYIRDGRLPTPVQFGSKDYWHPADFEAFLDATFRRSAFPSHAPEIVEGPLPSQPTANQAPPSQTSDGVRGVRGRAREAERLRQLNRQG